MNNLFNAFSIKVPGTILDDKVFWEYSDYSSNTPTDEQTVLKAEAFVKLKHLKRKLNELAIAVYCDVKFSTPGTAGTVPGDAEIVVAYPSIQPFVSEAELKDSDDEFEAAAAVIKAIIDAALKDEIVDEFQTVQKTYTRKKFPDDAGTETYQELTTVKVTAPASTAQSTVTAIKL